MNRESRDLAFYVETQLESYGIEADSWFWRYGVRPSELFNALSTRAFPEKLKRILCEKFGFDSWSQLKAAALSTVDA